MQRALATLVLATVAPACGAAGQVREATTAVYARQDSDATRVITPRVHVAADVGEASTVEAEVEVDAWTGASIDVTTAATPAITETRTAATFGGSHARAGVAALGDGDLRLSTSYRFSLEPDYVSHGAVLGAQLALAEGNTTASAYLLGSRDAVGRAGDPGFAEPVGSIGARLGVTQLLGEATLVELTWDGLWLRGFQASPYRWVAVGGDGTCAGATPFCLPELVPSGRDRHALSARGRRAIADHLSVGSEARAYLDTWGVGSIAVEADLAWLASEVDTVGLRGRYYGQGDADFYRPRYASLEVADGYRTRDRKLSAFWSAEAGVTWQHQLVLGDGDDAQAFDLGLRVTFSRLRYLAFVGLERVDAVEATLAVTWRRD